MRRPAPRLACDQALRGVPSFGVVIGSSPSGEPVLNNQTLRYACTIALCTPFTFAAATAGADPDAAASGDSAIDEVVVVANRAPEPLSKVGNSVTVLTDTDIKTSQFTVVSDLLAQTPGLSVSRAGGVGQPTSVFIRGAESDQTVVVIDGVQLNDPSTTAGGFDFENLLTGNISRIEILRGAQSTLYGSQAMGGVINITTADPTAPSGGGLQVEGGSHNTGYAAGNVGGKEGDLMWRISGNFNSTSGIPAFDEKLGGTRLCESKSEGGSGQMRYDITPDAAIRSARLLRQGAHRFRRLRYSRFHLRKRPGVR